jgi:aspartate-semialdehyde dehydrogenase
MKRLGIVGFRGMVGNTLMQRMYENKDFELFETVLFSTQSELTSYTFTDRVFKVENSNSIDALIACDIIVTCQGSEYTDSTLPRLKKAKWDGFWVDAASALRMDDNSLICLDPLNESQLINGIEKGIKIFTGGNCTVSLLLMALDGLYKEGVIEWVSSMTYQAASGAGSAAISELYDQYKQTAKIDHSDPLVSEREISKIISAKSMPLSYNILPFIDSQMPSGSSKEEWKAKVEASKILNREVFIDGTCVRVSSLRCHAQALTIKLNKSIDLETVEQILKNSNQWIKYIPNDKNNTLRYLTPHTIATTLDIGVGRLKKMNFGDEYLNMFTIGDQLLWGAAEPLRRMVRLLEKV